MIYGIEIYVVLKDIWGASDREVEALARWMLDAIVTAARDAGRHPRRRSASARQSKGPRTRGPARQRAKRA